MEDAEILELFRKRDETAIAEVRAKYGALCRRTAYGLLRSEEDAEECVGDMLFALWRSIPPAEPESLPGYALKIVRNRACKVLEKRHAQKRGGGEKELPLEELENALFDKREGPEQALEIKELTKVVAELLSELPREDRALFLRRYWFGESVGETAAAFGMTESKVKSRLWRVRKRLRKRLTERGYLNESETV